jgi:hypothetical protein
MNRWRPNTMSHLERDKHNPQMKDAVEFLYASQLSVGRIASSSTRGGHPKAVVHTPYSLMEWIAMRVGL